MCDIENRFHCAIICIVERRLLESLDDVWQLFIKTRLKFEKYAIDPEILQPYFNMGVLVSYVKIPHV